MVGTSCASWTFTSSPNSPAGIKSSLLRRLSRSCRRPCDVWWAIFRTRTASWSGSISSKPAEARRLTAMSNHPHIEQLLAENKELRQQLQEATATLDAIRNGEVDALVVAGSSGDKVYTLEGAEKPYRVLIEAMQQGAATLSPDGTILFCNGCLATMLGVPQEEVSGTALREFVPPPERPQLDAMLRQARLSHSVGEVQFQIGQYELLPVRLALSALHLPGTTALGLIVTDLTEQKRQEELVAAHRRKDDFLAILAHE